MKTVPTLMPLAVFLLWTLASFLCHKLAKLAMAPYVTDVTSFSPVVIPLVVTLVQTACCFASVSLGPVRGSLLYVTAASHFLATWATNSSLALTFASSAMAVKMLEPVTSALLQRLLLKTALGAEQVVGMVVVVVGAVLYVGDPLSSSRTTRAVVMALLSNVILGVRNVALKLQHGSSATSQLRSPRLILAFFAAVLLALLTLAYVTSDVIHDASGVFTLHTPTRFLLLSLASGACHVTYSYVSTNVVLRYMSVVSHAILNILKRVLVVLLLYVTGHRSASLWNWAGLALCILGLFLYSKKKIVTSSSLTSSVTSTPEAFDASATQKEWASGPGSQEASKRRAFLKFLLLPLAVIFVICVTSDQPLTTQLSRFQPRLRYLNVPDESLASQAPELKDLEERTEFVSKVLRSNPKIPGKTMTGYAQNLRFGHENWTDGRPLIENPIVYQPERKSVEEVEEFLSRENLLATPFDTDGVMPYLTTSQAVIAETKRVHSKLFSELLRGKKYAVLFDLASHENKGDAAITVGELILLENLGIKLLFFVNIFACRDNYLMHALAQAQKQAREEVVVLMHGGGNIFGYPGADVCRGKVLKLFAGYKMVLFPQSIYMHASKSHFDWCLNNYCCNPNLTMLMRDRLSLHIARRLFANGTRLLLAPDMAFQIGHVDRFAPPYYDVIWQGRADAENPLRGKIPRLPDHVTMKVWDWLYMKSIPGNGTVQRAVNILRHGLGILQEGRVLVTDRLHGHILSTLLDIPHVLLDNCHQKLSSFHNTWTRGLKNCRLADNAQDAARLAMELLEEYGPSLPRRLSAADINENV